MLYPLYICDIAQYHREVIRPPGKLGSPDVSSQHISGRQAHWRFSDDRTEHWCGTQAKCWLQRRWK